MTPILSVRNANSRISCIFENCLHYTEIQLLTLFFFKTYYIELILENKIIIFHPNKMFINVQEYFCHLKFIHNVQIINYLLPK